MGRLRARILLSLIALSLPLLACAGSGIVRKFAEPIDKGTCKVDCKMARMKFYEYDYWKDRCDCEDSNGDIIALY